MIPLKITDEDINLLQELKDHPHQRIRHKAIVLLFKNQNLSHQTIADSLRISRNTVRNYVKGYREKGIAFVTAINAYRPQAH